MTAHRRSALAAFGAGAVLTALVAALLATTAADRDRHAFEAAAGDAQAAIVDRVETSVALLRGTAGLFAANEPHITVEAFRRYVARLALREQYTGILGIGYTRRIAPGERAGLEREMAAQGHAGFRVWPGEEREELHSIVFLEPLDQRNQAAIGYDMYTHPVRREAMERARDSGGAAASAMVQLVQEIDERKQPGFLIYLPVYRTGAIPKSVEERRAALAGFAYSPIRAVDFLSSAFASPPEVSLAVYHGRDETQTALLYAAGEASRFPRFTRRSTIDVVGQPWTFVFRSRATLADSALLPLAAVAAGLALAWLLAVLVGREASARGELQRALERERFARSEAERANAMKDEFLATLSHELRTPLNAIIGWAELLRRGRLAEPEVRTAIDVVDRNARAQARLIDDLLDMNRIITGKMRLEVQPVDAAAVIGEALATLQPAADAKGVHLQPPGAGALVLVRGDPARLQQVVWNLVSNAIKFTPRGGRVQVALERTGEQARITVSDTGEGIEPQFLERIFERFTQADATITRRHGGLGLGLAIVKRLVELHGGTVRAESAGRGRGATFAVELPLVRPSEAPPPPAADPAAMHAELRGVKVLVVEDEADARSLMRRVLEDAGAAVECTASAAEALATLARFRPDVLLSDIGMPGMDGYEMMRRLRALPADGGGKVPAAAITAYARPEDRLEAMRAGFQTHLVKPLRREEVLAVVGALAGRSGSGLRAL